MRSKKNNLNDKININESLVITKFSGDKQTGFSLVEDEREFSSQRENNIHNEQAKLKSNKKTGKEKQELMVALRLLPNYNKLHNTNYNDAENVEQDDSIDVICTSDNVNHPNLNLQIRVSDDEAVGTLFKQNFIVRGGTGSELFCRACIKAIDEKSKKYSIVDKANIVLALDGWPAVYPQDFEDLKSEFGEYLKNTGFKEIWFVGWDNATIVKLF